MRQMCYGLDVTHFLGLHPDQCALCAIAAHPDAPLETIPTEGLTAVGEITSRTMREARQEPDFLNARAAGASFAYMSCLVWVQDRIRAAGPYDDTRSLTEMVVWLSDRIRETNSPKQIG